MYTEILPYKYITDHSKFKAFSRHMVNFQGLFKANSNSRPFQGTAPNSRPFQACANPAIQGIRFLDAEMGLLAIWVDIQRWLSIRPTFRRLGRAHGVNLRPGLTVREGPRWVHGAPRRVPCAWPIWAHCAPLANSDRAHVGRPMCHPRGDHVWSVWTSRVGPKWVHGGAQMSPMCLVCMGPWWPPGQFCLGPTALSIPYLYRVCNVGIISCTRI